MEKRRFWDTPLYWGETPVQLRGKTIRLWTLVVAVTALVALSSAVMLVGATYSFQKRLDYLSDRYPIYEFPWKEYLPYFQGSFGYEWKVTCQTSNWIRFKSKLLQATYDGTLSQVWYDSKARIIWFSENPTLAELMGWDPPGRTHPDGRPVEVDPYSRVPIVDITLFRSR